MTYCLAIAVRTGLVFVSDSRTNAGVDQISSYSKMHRSGREGDRQFVVMTAGNLATSQGVLAHLERDRREGAPVSLDTVADMQAAADYLGTVLRAEQDKHGGGPTFEASLILGGQVAGSPPAVYLVYPQGNYITTSKIKPFLQIGESKYGKPILDRIITPESSVETAALCGLVSMDSTMRSNLTVGPPIEVMVYDRDSLRPGRHYVFEEDSDYLRQLNRVWDANLKAAFDDLPPIAWSSSYDQGGLPAESSQ